MKGKLEHGTGGHSGASHCSQSIVFPDGRRVGGMTYQQAKDALCWLPVETRMEPGLPPGNPLALKFLDAVISANV